MTTYEEARSGYFVHVPECFNAVIDIVERLASEAPDRFALESVGADGETFDTQTFSALAINVQKAAKTFLGLGIGKGDHVFIMLPRCPEWYFAMLAAMRIGAVPLPAPNMLTAKDIRSEERRVGKEWGNPMSTR